MQLQPNIVIARAQAKHVNFYTTSDLIWTSKSCTNLLSIVIIPSNLHWLSVGSRSPSPSTAHCTVTQYQRQAIREEETSKSYTVVMSQTWLLAHKLIASNIIDRSFLRSGSDLEIEEPAWIIEIYSAIIWQLVAKQQSCWNNCKNWELLSEYNLSTNDAMQ